MVVALRCSTICSTLSLCLFSVAVALFNYVFNLQRNRNDAKAREQRTEPALQCRFCCPNANCNSYLNPCAGGLKCIPWDTFEPVSSGAEPALQCRVNAVQMSTIVLI